MFQYIVLLIPVFLIAVGIEWYVSHRRNDKKYTRGNTMMNITLGAIDQAGGLIHMALLYLAMDYVFENYRLFTIHNGWYQWLLGFIAIDFISYWYHRFSHRVNILWAGHITHHSSELYNLSNSFRISLFQGFNRILFWTMLPLFGFEPVAMIVIFKISGLYEFFLHTEYIPKLGFLEKILITPSTHRVHHGKNDIYIDKNFGANLVVWDKLFGTYQEETEPVVYGVKAEYTDDDALKAIGVHYVYIFRAMARSKRFSDKIKWIFMPPEWGAANAEPVSISPSKKRLEVPSKWVSLSYFQLVMGTLGIWITLGFQDYLTLWNKLICFGVFLFSMHAGVKLLNGNTNEDTEKNRTFGNGVLMAVLLYSVFVYKQHMLLPLLWYQVILFVYSSLLDDKSKFRRLFPG